jgi:hypothetical protein
MMKLLFDNSDKYPVKKIAACPGPMDKDQLKRLEEKQILFLDLNSPEESLQKIFAEPPNEEAKTKEDEEKDKNIALQCQVKSQDKGQERGQKKGKEKGQETGQGNVQEEALERGQDESQEKGIEKDQERVLEKGHKKGPEKGQEKSQEIMETDKKKLVAAIVFLLSCHIYQNEDSNLKEKVVKALEKKDLASLKEICDEKSLQKIVEKVIADQQKEEILDKSLEGRGAKYQTLALQSMAHIDETTKKQKTRIAAFLSKEYKIRNTSIFLDPIQQQIMSDKNPRQLILGIAATGKTVLVQLKAWDLLEKDPACKVLIILPQEGVVDVYQSYFGSAHKDRLFIMTSMEDWKRIAEDHSPHILIDEFAAIQV